MRIPFFGTDLTAAQVSPMAGALAAAPKYYTGLQKAGAAQQNLLQQRQATAQQLQKTLQAHISTQTAANVLGYQLRLLHQKLGQQIARTGIAGAKAAVAPTVEGGAAASAVGGGQTSLAAGQQALPQQIATTQQKIANAGIAAAKKHVAPAIEKAKKEVQQQAAKQAGIKTEFLPQSTLATIHSTILNAMSPIMRDKLFLASDPGFLKRFMGFGERQFETQGGQMFPFTPIAKGYEDLYREPESEVKRDVTSVKKKAEHFLGIHPHGGQHQYHVRGKSWIEDPNSPSGYKRVR